MLDMAQWDMTESVYLESVRGPSMEQRELRSSTDFVSVAKRRNVTIREQAASGGVYTGSDVNWHIPATLLVSGVIPRVGDVVIDGKQRRWTVLEVQENHWGQHFKLTTRDLRIAHNLRDTIIIQRATIIKDAAGVNVKLFPPDGGSVTYNNLPCRVQLISEQVLDERGIRGREGTYTITADRQIDVNTEDRILWGQLILDVVGYRQAELISDLPVLDALLKV